MECRLGATCSLASPAARTEYNSVNIYHSQHCPLEILNLDVDTIGIFYIDLYYRKAATATDRFPYSHYHHLICYCRENVEIDTKLGQNLRSHMELLQWPFPFNLSITGIFLNKLSLRKIVTWLSKVSMSKWRSFIAHSSAAHRVTRDTNGLIVWLIRCRDAVMHVLGEHHRYHTDNHWQMH